MKKSVYLDYAATTPLSKEAFLAMEPYFTQKFGNADSLHDIGKEARCALEKARKEVAECLNAEPEEIYFTSGGTESNNWAVKCTAKNHIIVSAIEHASVLAAAKNMEPYGYRVTELPVDSRGFCDGKTLENTITPDTGLISIGTANNEIGTVQPIEELVQIAKKHNILFHTDAVQAAGTLKLDVKKSGVDLLTLSAHKFYGPKGVGILYAKKGVNLKKLVAGGQQESGFRGGTSDIAGAAGLSAAFKEAVRGLEKNAAHIKSLRDYFVSRVENEIPFARYNGARTERLPQNANFSFPGFLAAELLEVLNRAGVYAASGSACSSGSKEPSHVLVAVGAPDAAAKSAIRFTFGRSTTKEETAYAVETLKSLVCVPLFKAINRGGKRV